MAQFEDLFIAQISQKETNSCTFQELLLRSAHNSIQGDDSFSQTNVSNCYDLLSVTSESCQSEETPHIQGRRDRRKKLIHKSNYHNLAKDSCVLLKDLFNHKELQQSKDYGCVIDIWSLLKNPAYRCRRTLNAIYCPEFSFTDSSPGYLQALRKKYSSEVFENARKLIRKATLEQVTDQAIDERVELNRRKDKCKASVDVGRYLKQYLDEVRQGGKIKAKYSLSSVVVTNLPSSEEPEESIEEELEHFSEGGKTEFTDSVQSQLDWVGSFIRSSGIDEELVDFF